MTQQIKSQTTQLQTENKTTDKKQQIHTTIYTNKRKLLKNLNALVLYDYYDYIIN